MTQLVSRAAEEEAAAGGSLPICAGRSFDPGRGRHLILSARNLSEAVAAIEAALPAAFAFTPPLSPEA